MAPAKRKITASTPSVAANKRTAATTAASASKVTKASAQKTKPLTARQKAALARAALAESSGNAVVATTPSTVGKAATRASGRTKRGAAAMAPVEEEEMESTIIAEEQGQDTTMHDVTAVEEVEVQKEMTARATRGRPRRAAAAVAETPMSVTATATRVGGRGRKKKVEEPVVVEEETTQQDEVAEEVTREETQLEEEEEPLPIPGAWRNGPPPASISRMSSSLGLGFKAHTATGMRNEDVELRRKLGEMTQKYEALELKYRDLREIAVKEAERNFDRLRKHSEERTAASDQLIAALKAELTTQKEAARENVHVQKQLEASESQLSTLNAKVAELTSSLTKSKTEINALNIKLTASRQAEAAAVAKIGQPQVPGSAMKNKQNGNRMLTMGNSEAIAQATQQAQLKEDLYSDLTGLIVRGVKRDQQTGEDVYDCIQTGKNGTLHFKLAHISANTAHVDADETTQIFDEDQFHYMPQLDASRDRALIDLLPDYLVEEITFPRQHAAKFYSRVNKALTETVPQV